MFLFVEKCFSTNNNGICGFNYNVLRIMSGISPPLWLVCGLFMSINYHFVIVITFLLSFH